MLVLFEFSIKQSFFCILFVILLFTNFQDNPSDKDMNQGTLVIFNLDSSVSNDELRQIFGAYGEVKEVGSFSFIRKISK